MSFSKNECLLAEFLGLLALPDPAKVFIEAEPYLPPLDQWLKVQIVNAEDRVWLLTRVGYFVGEYLEQRRGGEWLVNEIPDSRYFARYVMGRFDNNPNAMVDPFEVADICISEPPGRSLLRLLDRVEKEIAET